ncbi:ubiquinone biosynthesis O-methyltransferase-like [Arctopsyche grandis]|uniref:ubiquinone biosynthesis O-methyltransferase-like n=1 Tax=Arctopsyche grandis TaxID=121162 RepID=UPI00406D769E
MLGSKLLSRLFYKGISTIDKPSNSCNVLKRNYAIVNASDHVIHAEVIKAVENSNTSRSTVDQIEIDLHSSLREQWWNKNGSMRGLHALNKLRVPFVRDGLLETNETFKINIDTPHPLTGANILEVGCGGGILSEPLARIGANVTGVDASEQLINLAREHATLSPRSNLKYIHDTIEAFSERHHEAFDAVVASEVIEHVTEKDLFVASCVKALRPGGSLFLTTLNKTRLSWLGGIVIAENVLNIVPKGTHHFDKFISPEQLSRLVDNHGCKTRLVHGMFYLFLTNQWCWTSNTSINYAMQFIKK